MVRNPAQTAERPGSSPGPRFDAGRWPATLRIERAQGRQT